MPILTWRFVQVPFKKYLHGRLIFSDWLLPLALLFLDTLLPRVFEDCGSEAGAAFGVGFARSYSNAGNYIGLPSNTALFLSTGNKYLFSSFNVT